MISLKSFVIAENADAARELCAGARTLADEVCLVCIGAEPVLNVADVVYAIAVPEGSPVDDAYETVIGLVAAEGPELVLVEPTRRMKTIAGRLAARNEAAVVTDVISLSDGVAENLYFGGTAHKKQKAVSPLAIYSLSGALFDGCEPSGTDAVQEVAWVAPAHPVAVRSVEETPKTAADLTKCDVIVAAGRGFAAEEDLSMARELAEKVGGELGCTRPLTEGVDWLPRELYIGVSGLMLAPKTYIGLGLSGQMQHMVGVNRAKTIIAVNKDKNAPVFKQADLGLVGDIYQVLPVINESL